MWGAKELSDKARAGRDDGGGKQQGRNAQSEDGGKQVGVGVDEAHSRDQDSFWD